MKGLSKWIGISMAVLLSCISQDPLYAGQTNVTLSKSDSLSHKDRKRQRREEFRKNYDRYFFNFQSVFSNLDTELGFELADGLFTFKLGLEKNLGLPEKRTFYTGSFIDRLTPLSGIYAQYYGINRLENVITESDFIFLEDTIPAGTRSQAYFNTQVISVGYLLSILQDNDAFLGAFINIYMMWLDTGVNSDIGNIDVNLKFIAPLPNVGLAAMFKLTHWMYLNGEVGFFVIHTPNFGGSLYDLSIRLLFKPVRWFGISLAYEEFDVKVEFPFDNVNTTVDYNFKGPSLGLSFTF